PTASTGPGIWRITLATYAESALTPRSGLTTARTSTPAAISRLITPAHPEASAKAPWTKTTVGVLETELVSVMLIPSATGRRPWPPSPFHPPRRNRALLASDDDTDNYVITGGQEEARDDR